jgi:pimeloyl-ACP methyl ester carboxylesterase
LRTLIEIASSLSLLAMTPGAVGTKPRARNRSPERRLIRLAVLLPALVGAACHRSPLSAQPNLALASITVHAPDAFYDPPARVPSRPGALLRSEPLADVTLPAGMTGWRILYTTTVNDSTPATAVATVFAPTRPPAGPRPVITWEHGTTGALQRCMPSLVSAPTAGIPALDKIVAAGWVIVATDYSFAEKGGPHPYLIGEGEARAALDSVRAARQMPELSLDARTVVWGHSQGGHAALWTGIIGPRYAPDVEIVGVAAIAPAADMTKILAMNQAVDKRLGPYVALSYSRFYPDIAFDQAVRPAALQAAREIANLCGFLPPEDPQRVTALTATFDGPALATVTDAVLAARLVQNAADHPIAAPLLIAQGRKDVIVPPPATDAYVDARCAAGQRLEYWTFATLDHGTIVQPGTPLDAPLMAWTTSRFANVPEASGCVRRSF